MPRDGRRATFVWSATPTRRDLARDEPSPRPADRGSPRPLGEARRLIGRPRATHELEDTLLPKSLALPIFSSDPISSVAYATEAALAVLVAASLAPRHLVLPISVAIAALLLIVALSYSQGIKAYESTSGGSYVFARENLGVLPALVAGAALLTDYILTVAVSVAAGVFAITSAVPSLGVASGAALARLHRRAHAREPARRARVGPAVRVPDVRLHRGDVR